MSNEGKRAERFVGVDMARGKIKKYNTEQQFVAMRNFESVSKCSNPFQLSAPLPSLFCTLLSCSPN